MICKFLVGWFKNQMVWIIFKTLWNLRPNRLILFPCLCSDSIITRAKHSPPSIIIMVIDNYIHTIVQCIVYNFFYPSKHLIADSIISVFRYHIWPCYRNTNCIKSITMYTVYILLCSYRCTPCLFKICSFFKVINLVYCLCSLHSISKIDTGSHLVFDKILCR